jgi:hypothetical protein
MLPVANGQIVYFDGTSTTSYAFPVLNPATPPLQVFATAYSHYVENKKYYSNELNLTSHSDSPFSMDRGPVPVSREI